MISQAADYVFTDVTGVDVAGKIVPALEGTAGLHVIRFEDIPFLTEMLREREYWEFPSSNYNRVTQQYEGNPPNDVYNPDNRQITRLNLDAIARGAPRNLQSLLNRDWIPTNAVLPTGVSFHELNHGVADYLRDNATHLDYEAIPPFEASDFKFITSLDDLRALYHNLSNLKRMFLRGDIRLEKSIEEWQSYSNWESYHWMGLVPSSPNAKSTRTDVEYGDINGNVFDEPRIYTEQKNGVERWVYGVCYDKNNRIWWKTEVTIPTPYIFMTKGYGKRIKGDGFALENNLHAWVSFTVMFGNKVKSRISQFKMTVSVSLSRESVSLSELSDRADCYYRVPIPQELVKQQAFAHAREIDSDFDSKPDFLEVSFSGLTIDSGPIWMNSEIDSLGHYEIENNKPVWHGA